MAKAANEKKNQIIEAAKKILSEQGFDKLNYRSIAREAKISPGTLYYYYQSKDDLLYDVMDSSTRVLSGFAESIEKGENEVKDIPKHLYQGLVNHIKNVDRNKIFLHVLHEALLDRNLAMREGMIDKYHSWVNDFAKIFRLSFDIPVPTSKALAILYDSMIDGLLLKELLGLKPLEQDEVKDLVKLFLNSQFGKTQVAVQSDIKHGKDA